MGLSLPELQAGLPEGGLLGSGIWRWSPEPFRLSPAEARALNSLGHPLAKFQQACDTIYRRSAAGRLPEWIAAWLDAGKPDWLINHQRASSTAAHLPRVIRPDLILTPDGFALSELDSVPGGIGITGWLSRIYSQAGYDVLGGSDGMIDGFKSLMPTGGTVLVSDESSDYRPEMEWITRQCGHDWSVKPAEQQDPADPATGGNFYRFFELYDWRSIPAARALAEQSAAGNLQLTPPFKPHLEEKLWLALLWSPSLRKIWRLNLRGSHLQRLEQITPFGWVLDPTPLPPQAAIPRMSAHSWDEVAGFSQKERRLVLKVSGFHETAWGSRGVFIGHDMPADDWSRQLHNALNQSSTQPWVLQEFHDGRRIQHPVFRDDGSIEMMTGRVRLCPYYFTDDTGKTTLGGCLATIVPADKKKIHGMSDGVLVPCVVVEG